MNDNSSRQAKIASVVFLAAFVFLTSTVRDLGMSWDEGNDIQMAKGAVSWFGTLGSGGAPSFSRQVIEEHWGYEWKQHPAVSRIVYALSYGIFGGIRGEVIYREWLVYRSGTAIAFAVLVSLVFFFGWRHLGAWQAGAVAALSLLGMPRVLGHAHLVQTDVILCAFFFMTALAFLSGLETRRGRIAFGILMGLLPAIKFTGFFLWIPLFLYGLIFARGRLRGNFIAALTLSPLIFFIVQPMYWHQPAQAFASYVGHFTNPDAQSSLVTYYFGEYYRRTAPWTYPWVMTALSLPLAILSLAALGALSVFKKSPARKMAFFCIFNAVFILLLFTPGRVAKYDGVRLFMIVFPFWALLAGAGFHLLLGRFRAGVQIAALVLFALSSALTVSNTRPFYLSYFNELAGGIKGAEERGLEVTYWGEMFTPEFAGMVNQALPYGARVSTAGYYKRNLERFQDMGLLRRDLRIVDYADDDEFLIVFNRAGLLDSYTRALIRDVPPMVEIRWRGVLIGGLYYAYPSTG
ncbi:MAG: glycosyltransferase family 39 protein [bacterium]